MPCALQSVGRGRSPVVIAPEKREVTGSTPVPTTGKAQFKGYFSQPSASWSKFRAHCVPIGI
jgi:hypothetical protein